MSEAVFPMQIEVTRRVSWPLVFGLFVALIVVALFILISVVQGRRSWIYLTIALPALVLGIRNASAVHQPKQALATLRAYDSAFELMIPRARPFRGAYIDQLYKASYEDVEQVILRETNFRLVARKIRAIGLQDGIVRVQEDLPYGDLTFDVHGDYVQAIANVLQGKVRIAYK